MNEHLREEYNLTHTIVSKLSSICFLWTLGWLYRSEYLVPQILLHWLNHYVYRASELVQQVKAFASQD